jgi:pimeloyl-ACP methyl ester carboxylesterase
MRPNILPSCREMAVCIEDMLKTWNYSTAHFMGHSYGTSVLAWVVQQAKHLIASFCLFEPISFLLLKPDLALNSLYNKSQDPHSVIFSYWIAGELYLAHTLTRNFRWYDNALWPDNLTFPTLVTLAGNDELIPSVSVKYHLEAEKLRRAKMRIGMALDMVWLDKSSHGSFLGDNEYQVTVLDAVKRFIR